MAGQLTIEVVDLNSNFEGLPEYKGSMPGRLVFTNITAIDLSVEPASGQRRIYGVDIEGAERAYAIAIHTSPGGVIRFTCSSLFIDNDRPT